MCTLLFFWSRKPYLQLYVRVRDEKQQQQQQKLVDNMNNVEDEADAARHSFSNKAPVGFIFWEPLIIIDDR